VPDTSPPLDRLSEAEAAPEQAKRGFSPLLRRILLLNALPPALLAASLLYLDQYQNALLGAEVEAMRTQARIYAGAIAEAAVRPEGERYVLQLEAARPLLRRLVDPSPNTQARLLDTAGLLVADSRIRDGVGGAVIAEPLPPPEPRGALTSTVAGIYERMVGLFPALLRGRGGPGMVVDSAPDAPDFDWQPDLGPDRREELRMALEGGVTPYIRRSADGRLLVSVAEPARRGTQSVGIVLLTREAREVDRRLFEIRASVLLLFATALILTVALSLYLSRTIATPMLDLARATQRIREGEGRAQSVPDALLKRNDEIGVLARDLQNSARALWARIDANERFAADVAHELRNPLTSVRSAIETLRRVEDPASRNRLLAIIADDAVRMDRLIGDISDSSRVDAELSRTVSMPVDIAPILEAEAGPLVVRGVEGRIVQVFRNLLGNALSFSPSHGTVKVTARHAGAMVEVVVEDQGPGIPEQKLESIFERFYSERPSGERFGQHSGLGLSISRQIVEGLRGRISAENIRDASGAVTGARFMVLLPAA
jgi:two-component system sensor histidine kinase ChvG